MSHTSLYWFVILFLVAFLAWKAIPCIMLAMVEFRLKCLHRRRDYLIRLHQQSLQKFDQSIAAKQKRLKILEHHLEIVNELTAEMHPKANQHE